MHLLFVVLLGLLLVVFIMGVARLIIGPSLPDRAVALDFMAYAAVGFIVVFGAGTDQPAFLDVAIALALVAFLSTVAFAHFIVLDQQRRDDDR
ncbi:MAG: monovalent cation/H+ antiporter complex subunit F [Candidatus Competibacteraceae bacterium]|nr:monovalent cation/H+ antiporter complex subunit F [Candidatus Competibacteraceae bacterium]